MGYLNKWDSQLSRKKWWVLRGIGFWSMRSRMWPSEVRFSGIVFKKNSEIQCALWNLSIFTAQQFFQMKWANQNTPLGQIWWTGLLFATSGLMVEWIILVALSAEYIRIKTIATLYWTLIGTFIYQISLLPRCHPHRLYNNCFLGKERGEQKEKEKVIILDVFIH